MFNKLIALYTRMKFQDPDVDKISLSCQHIGISSVNH